jgi:dolichol-phosphate mannosyltransferase
LSDDGARPESPLVSFVVPVLDEAPCVEELARRAIASAEVAGARCEVLFVDDGSKDDTPGLIGRLHAVDPRIKSVRFTRHFGHQAALCAGLRFATGDAVVTLDGDLQHPPEILRDLLAAWRAGADVVHTIRDEPSVRQPGLKQRTGRLFYRVMGLASGLSLAPESADFRLMDRRVVDAFNEMGEYFVFTRGMVPWLGFPDAEVRYALEERHAGRTKYSLGRMIRLAADGIFSFSILPLRLITALGAATTLFGIGYGIYGLTAYLAGEVEDGGWTSLLGLLLIFGGANLVSLGIVSEYVGRIYEEVKGRPRYVVSRTLGLDGQ